MASCLALSMLRSLSAFRIPLNTSPSFDRSLFACHSSPKKVRFQSDQWIPIHTKRAYSIFLSTLRISLLFSEWQRSAHRNLVSDGSGRYNPSLTVDRCNQKCLLCALPLHNLNLARRNLEKFNGSHSLQVVGIDRASALLTVR